MSDYVQIVETDEDGMDVMQALAILSAHEHRDTSQWRLVEQQHFKNGRLSESYIFVENYYDRPHEQFAPVKLLTFEARAIANAYVMEGIEAQMREIQDGDDEEEEVA